MPETFEELVTKVLAILPEARFGDDNDGQIIIYTNMKFVSDLTKEATSDIISMGDE